MGLLKALKKEHQTGIRKSLLADSKRFALPVGKRTSKRGKAYTEYRKNRTDLMGKNI